MAAMAKVGLVRGPGAAHSRAVPEDLAGAPKEAALEGLTVFLGAVRPHGLVIETSRTEGARL